MAASDFDDEDARLAAVTALAWTEEARDSGLEDIAALTAETFAAPMAIISLTGRDRQSVIAGYGVGRISAPLDSTFCQHVVLAKSMLVVRDALSDARFTDNPFVVGAPGVRFYAGAPLFAEDGHVLGTLCVVDTQPRPIFAVEERAKLAQLARLAEQRLHGRSDKAAAGQALAACAAAETRARAILKEAAGAFATCDRLAINLEGRVRSALAQLEQAVERGGAAFGGEVASLREVLDELAAAARLDRISAQAPVLFAPGALLRDVVAACAPSALRRGVVVHLIDQTDGAEILGDSWRYEEVLEDVLNDCVLLSAGMLYVQCGFEKTPRGHKCLSVRLSAERGTPWRFSGHNGRLVDTLAGGWELSREDRRLTVRLPARLHVGAPRARQEWDCGPNVLRFERQRADKQG